MIKLDQDGIPTDVISEDYMDSAVRAGILTITKHEKAPYLNYYVLRNNEFIRGPKTSKATNPKNFTRDQMLCLVAGLSTNEDYHLTIRKNLYSRIKSFLFAQNTERDEPGSTKYMKPHYFYKDSIPNVATVFNKNELIYRESDSVTIEYKKFDAADILMPQHIWHMIKASRTYFLYPFALIGLPCYLLDLVVHSLSSSKFEENQHICMAYVQGKWALKLFKMLNSNWETTSLKYWYDRNEIEYHEAIVKMMSEV